jgi:hypothetical protein
VKFHKANPYFSIYSHAVTGDAFLLKCFQSVAVMLILAVYGDSVVIVNPVLGDAAMWKWTVSSRSLLPPSSE